MMSTSLSESFFGVFSEWFFTLLVPTSCHCKSSFFLNEVVLLGTTLVFAHVGHLSVNTQGGDHLVKTLQKNLFLITVHPLYTRFFYSRICLFAVFSPAKCNTFSRIFGENREYGSDL